MAGSFESIKKQLDRKLLELATVKKIIVLEKKSRKKLKRRLKLEKETQEILRTVAEDVQNLAHKRICGLVSRCLSMILDDPYQFEIEFVKKRNKTEANLLLTKSGKRLDPDDSTGGGVIDLASFALRLACLTLKLPKMRKVLCLDEPFRFLSSNYRPKVRRMLEMLSEELGIQIIMATHSKHLRIGTIIELD